MAPIISTAEGLLAIWAFNPIFRVYLLLQDPFSIIKRKWTGSGKYCTSSAGMIDVFCGLRCSAGLSEESGWRRLKRRMTESRF